MKTTLTFVVTILISVSIISCGQDFKKTKSGLVYKIIPGGSKDSLAGANDVFKFNFIRKLNDSLLLDSYGKMPGFQPYVSDPSISYSPLEVLFMMRKGDSAVIVESFDTIIKKGYASQLPYGKKGDMIRTYIKVIEVFRSDSAARADYTMEMEKDRPRQEKEMKEQQEKEIADRKIQKEKEMEELKKSGGIEKQDKVVTDYLAKKNIAAVRAPQGTMVYIKEKGTGAPATNGKFITVKYAGRTLRTDSVFQASEYIFELGVGEVIAGWDDGILQFNKGGKGTLFIPGYLAYGKNPGPGANGQPYDALIFDVEILNVSDTREQANQEKMVMDSINAAKGNK